LRLDLYEVGKRFGERQALRDVTLSIPEFQSLAIVGPSGGGKTTLLRLIAGLTTPESGRLSINGQPIDYSEEALLAHRRGIGTVFQAYNLFPHLSARENVMLPLVKVHGLATQEARDVVDTLFERFHLSAHADQRPAELSGGQQQRVAIARAIVTRPLVLLADEPTGNLDSQRGHEIMELLVKLNREHGITILMVTHEPEMAHYASRTVRFVDGLVESDERKEGH